MSSATCLMANMDPQKTDTEEFQQIRSIGFKKDIKSCPKIASFFLCWLDLLGSIELYTSC